VPVTPGRAVFAPYCPQASPLSFRRVLSLSPMSPSRVDIKEALSLLARLVGTGSLGKATVAHVLTMLGGPMERMECWGPRGRNKRRPCKVRVSLGAVIGSNVPPDTVKTALLGSVENMSSADDIFTAVWT